MNRYIREKEHWDPHLKRTRDFIGTSFEGRDFASVAVLGSGWLLDVPLEVFLSRFRKVYLVDIFHPPQIRKKLERYNQVELVEADLTGGAIHQVWELSKRSGWHEVGDLTSAIHLESPLKDLHFDAVVSVNLLNQLDILLCDFLSGHLFAGRKVPWSFRAALQSFHLEWITLTPGCLVSDISERNILRSGGESVTSLLHTQLPNGFRSDRWTWEFDSSGTYKPGALTSMEVRAVEWA